MAEKIIFTEGIVDAGVVEYILGKIDCHKIIIKNQDPGYYKHVILNKTMIEKKTREAECCIHACGSKSCIKSVFETEIKSSDFNDNVKKISFLVDADSNHDDTLKEILKILSDNGFEIPENNSSGKVFDIIDKKSGKIYKTGLFLFPNCQDNGILEDLCRKAIAHNHSKHILEYFEDEIKKFDSSNRVKSPSKAILQTYFATMPEITYSPKVALREKYLDMKKFDKLKTFLEEFIK